MTLKLSRFLNSMLVIIVVLSGCSSIPMGTLLKLSSFDEAYVSTLDPKKIRAKITVNAFLDVNVENTQLGLSIENSNGEMELNFPLQVITITQNKAVSGLFSQQVASQTYLLKLSEKAISEFKTLQAQLTPPQQSQFGFTVSAKLKKHKNLTPIQQEQQLFMSIDLQLNEKEGFFTLFDQIELQDGKTDL